MRGTFSDLFYDSLSPVDLVFSDERTYWAIFNLKADKHLMNSYGVFSSGAFISIVDLMLIVATRCNNPYTKRIVTAHLEMDLLNVVRQGEALRVETSVYKTGKFLNFGSVLFINENKRVVARGSAICSCLYPKEGESAQSWVSGNARLFNPFLFLIIL